MELIIWILVVLALLVGLGGYSDKPWWRNRGSYPGSFHWWRRSRRAKGGWWW